MPYFPLSQVKTNLYSNGSEFTLEGADYTGDYFITSKGEAYTGKTPQDNPVNLLQPSGNSLNNESPVNIQNEVSIDSLEDNFSYFRVDYPYYESTGRNTNNIADAPLKPILEISPPTKQDYQIGEFTRYFLRKSNEIEFIETSKNQFNLYSTQSSTVQWQLYIPISINWTLDGTFENAYRVNQNIARLTESRNKVFGFVNSFNGKFGRYHKEEIKKPNIKTTSTKKSGLY